MKIKCPRRPKTPTMNAIQKVISFGRESFIFSSMKESFDQVKFTRRYYNLFRYRLLYYLMQLTFDVRQLFDNQIIPHPV
jgi:hypothetical protein